MIEFLKIFRKKDTKLFDELLAIDDYESLDRKGIKGIKVVYNQTLMLNVLALFFPKYRDIKIFDTKYWVVFRSSIIIHLYDKGLCKIKFISDEKKKKQKA